MLVADLGLVIDPLSTEPSPAPCCGCWEAVKLADEVTRPETGGDSTIAPSAPFRDETSRSDEPSLEKVLG